MFDGLGMPSDTCLAVTVKLHFVVGKEIRSRNCKVLWWIKYDHLFPDIECSTILWKFL